MTPFEAGFIKYAQESGLSDEQATHIFKRAFDHPATQNMFKDLQNPEAEEEQPRQQTPGNLDMLAQLMRQELIDNQMHHFSGHTQRVQL